MRGARPGGPLVAQVEAAARKSELRVVEDQVDAVVCAYVALFADPRSPTRTTTYGDGETGYIVTPTLPPGHSADAARGQPRVREDRRPAAAVRGVRRAATPTLAQVAAASSSTW